MNSIQVTFKSGFLVVDIDQLTDVTADDYLRHICESVNHLAEVFSRFNNEDYQDCRQRLIDSISNTISDRVASNHAAIRLINELWNKEFNELCVTVIFKTSSGLSSQSSHQCPEMCGNYKRKIVWQ